jgi:ArsR family transcriptional regulator, arsenate/arsenite/antimonite-responsive transcriptional repressor
MDRNQIERISKALGDATRLRIFEAISRANGIVCSELVAMRGVTPATVSHHMKVLADAGLIRCRREGQFVYSESVPDTIAAYSRALTAIARRRTAPTRAPRTSTRAARAQARASRKSLRSRAPRSA